jgi:putative ABC transport system permease protein
VKILKRSLVQAIGALRKNKLQTALTMTGMTIGVATVLTMIALGRGAQGAISDQIRSAGMNLIVVTAGNYQAPRERPPDDAIEPSVWHPPRQGRDSSMLRSAVLDDREQGRLFRIHAEDDPMAVHDHPLASQRLGDSEAGLGAAATLTLSDAAEIRKIPAVQYVSSGVHMNAHIEGPQVADASGLPASPPGVRWFTRLHGDDVAQPLIRRAWVFPHGRYFNEREERDSEQVIVLGSVVSEKLFGSANPVGRTVKIWHQPFKVVGVIASGSWILQPEAGDDQFDAIYVPVTTVQRLLNLSKLNDITITTQSTGDVTQVAHSITNLLRQRHHISIKMPDDFTVSSQARKALASGGLRPEVAAAVVGNVSGLEKVTLNQLGKTLDRASQTMTALLISIAAVSLLVGGIGIMNVMMLSVTERTREIGILRAVGATATDVLSQFLLEAMGMSLAGGLLGIALGLVTSLVVTRLVHWSIDLSPVAVFVSFAMSAAVGIFFGYYPARQAAKALPIESLRFES